MDEDKMISLNDACNLLYKIFQTDFNIEFENK